MTCGLIAGRTVSRRLSNGVLVYFYPDRGGDLVFLAGMLEGGAAVDRNGGPAPAMLAQMLGRGTKRRKRSEISTLLESNGAHLGFESTEECFLIKGSCLSEDLDLLLDLAGESLREPSFPPEELEIVKQDARVAIGDAATDAGERAFRSACARVLGDSHPYATYPLGTFAQIDALEREDLQQLHGRVACGPNLRLALTGDVDPERALSVLEETFGSLPARAEWTLPPDPDIEPRYGREHIELPGKMQVEVTLARPGIAKTDSDFHTAALANFIFGGSFVSRLNTRLRDQLGLTYGADSRLHSGVLSGVWVAGFGVAATDLERALDEALLEMDRFVNEGTTEEELDLAKRHLTGNLPIKLETNAMIGWFILDAERNGFGIEYLDEYGRILDGISRHDVLRVARRLLDCNDVAIATAGTLS